MSLSFETEFDKAAVIKVIGVGGGGCNAVNQMIQSGLHGVDFIAINTDRQALNKSLADTKIQIGEKLTKGLGAGSNPEVGQHSAEETIDAIINAIEGADMVFIAAGMGGGTGTGAAPIIAKAAHDLGILTVAVVTKPFAFEGKRRMRQAELGISYLRQFVDSLVVVPNEKLLGSCQPNTTWIEAFRMSDNVLLQGVEGISELISDEAYINLDFTDVRTVMRERGVCHMGIGHGTGENRASIAVTSAIESPLLETTIDGATGILLYIVGGTDLGMMEVSEIASMVQDQVSPNCLFKFGAAIKPEMQGEVSVTLIATGFDDGMDEKVPESSLTGLGIEPKREEEEVIGMVDGLSGYEVSLTDLLGESGEFKESPGFEIPDFLLKK